MKRAARSAIALTVAAGVIGGGIWGVQSYVHHSQALVVVQCATSVGGVQHTLDPEQAGNAATISAVAVGRALPARATTIALATAYQESKLRNLDYGDNAGPDSRGLFQQRPSQGWGTQQQVMTPVYAAGAFYDQLVRFDYQSMSITQAAQKVQRSAFPDAYAPHEERSRAFAAALTGQSAGALNCTLRRTDSAGDAKAVSKALTAEYGRSFVDPQAQGSTVSVPVASKNKGWAVAQWAVAHAQQHQTLSVSYGGLEWTRATGKWEAPAASDSAQQGQGSKQVRITVATEAEQG
ncbi:hypothetical protein [Galactobacter caseinivorans]|uniref:hypothetical protein n=1 Tax=Galactobacter caseinivorans TaxID=2676123 RepID=UPI0018F40707|nr:hypothetical protein [Galactobacter caseinivorans]